MKVNTTIIVLTMLETSSLQNPGKVAVREREKFLTYSELNELSKRTGSMLAKRIAPRTPVGVYMEKGIDALVSFFGIVYAGGFYSMFNTELPDERLKTMKSVLDTGFIITTRELLPKAETLFSGAEIYIIEDLMQAEIDACALDAIRSRMIDTDPLYINFTSGSTGIPKGIAVSHRSVIDFIGCFTRLFSINEDDIIANQAPFDFDVSVKDIYSSLFVGAELVIVPREYFSAPVKLLDLLCDNKVTVMIWAVSALCLISTFHGLDYKTPETVKKILFSGEVMPYKHLRQWQTHLPGAMYVNLYGPTEITCNCTYHILQKDRDYSAGIPIGIPFPNEDVFLLSADNKRITEKGVTGSIVVRGTALALGYYRDPQRTAQAFVQDPINSCYPETVYLTGDLGEYDENGELVFRGRSDNQIKYMGHRIELEEIERAMSAIEGVDRCMCIFDESKQKLKGFYMGTIEKNQLHTIMRETMPAFMVPGYIRKVEEMILTKNGKLDRKKTAELVGGSKNG